MSFVRLPVETDFDELLSDAYDRMAEQFPGWIPNEASLEAADLAERARLDREMAQVAANMGEEALIGLGRLIGIEWIEGAYASMDVTITAADAAGYTIPEGFQFAYRLTGDTLVGFVTTEQGVIPPGSTTVSVSARAVELGRRANGIIAGSSFEPVDALVWVSSIQNDTEVSGGADEEAGGAFLTRIVRRLTLLADRPILPNDFAILAQSVPGVYRARALDGYNPDTDTYNNERTIAVAGIDIDGLALSSGTKDAIDDLLQAKRELNFLVKVTDPTYTTIDVVFTATALPGYDPAVVEIAAEQAVTAYIDPATWGGGAEDPPAWRDEDIVRYLEVASVLNSVDGLDVVTGLSLNGATFDVALSGPLPLPRKVEAGGSTVAGTVTA